MQETHWTDDLNDCILREWGGNILFNNFEYNARGTAILFSPTFDYRMYNNTSDPHGRTVQTLIEHAERKFNLINIYAPNTNAERRIYFHSISTFISSTEDNILGGDFNCIADHKLDKLGGNPFARKTAITILNTITQQHNLTDIWRDRNRDVKKFTWTGKNTQNSFIHTRIDKFFISSSLTPFVTKTDISPFSFSDHDLIMLTLDLHTQPRGEGYWLFNNNLLDDDFLLTEINQFWTNWLTRKNDFNTPLKWWDTAKHNFKNIAVKRSTQLANASVRNADDWKINFSGFNENSQMAMTTSLKLIFRPKTNYNTIILMNWLLLPLERKYNTPRKEKRVQGIFTHWKTTGRRSKLLNC